MSSAFIVAIIFFALFASLIFMPIMIRYSIKINAIDKPGKRKLHDSEIPVLGGLVFSFSFIITSIIFLRFNAEILALFSGLVVILFTGLIDDLKHISHYLKFAGEILASLIFIIFGDAVIISFGHLVGPEPLNTGVYSIPISVFCMVGVMNALNMADGMDGLAAGISAIACLFLGYFAYISEQPDYLFLLLILFGSLLGFLYYNKYPARIFMGDTGSLVLGYVLSAICILLVQKPGNGITVFPISMAIIMGLPIVDAILVMSIRIIKGKSPFLPDNTHLHHRLHSFGFHHKTVVLIVYALMILCGLLAVSVNKLPEWIQFYTGVAVAIIIFGSVYLVQYIHRNMKLQKSSHE